MSGFWQFILKSNIWVSLAVGLLTLSTSFLYNEPSLHPALFAFFSTLFVYNYQRLYKSRSGPETEQRMWVQANQPLLVVLTLGALFGTATSALFLEVRSLLLMIPGALISIFYVLRSFSKKRSKKSLRELPYLKIYLIALIWAVTTVLLPVFDTGQDLALNTVTACLCVERLLFVLAITIPFDVRDLPYDKASMRTLPQILGSARAIHLGMWLIAISFGLSVYLFILHFYSLELLLGVGAICMLGMYLLYLSSGQRKQSFYLGILDGVFVIQALVLMILS